MKVVFLPLQEVKPYENNPRQNEHAVNAVVQSIKEFGFKVPVLIDGQGTIVAGHTRYKAAVQLGMNEVPCIRLDGLTDEQIRAFRIADNKTSEYSTWDKDLLRQELEALQQVDYNLDLTGFEDWELENLIGDIDDSTFNDFFETASPRETSAVSISNPTNFQEAGAEVYTEKEGAAGKAGTASISSCQPMGEVPQPQKIKCPYCGEWFKI